MRFSILKAGKGLVKWLFNPAPFWTAVRRTYRRPFQLATGLFVVSLLVGFVLAPNLQDVDRGAKEHPEAERGEKKDAATQSREAVMERVTKALGEGDVEEANRAMAELDWEDLMAPPRAHVSDLLTRVWFCVLVAVMANTLLCVVSGFIFGLFPAGSTVAHGVVLGLTLSIGVHREGGGSLVGYLWSLPVLLILALAGLLSAAIGFDMAKYVARPLDAEWFKDHIRKGLAAWSTAVVPAMLVAMILLGAAFVTIVVVSGDPVIE